MFGQHLQVLLLLGQLFLQLQELLPLTLLDGVVLGGTLALLEGVTVRPSVGSPVGYKQKEGSSRLARLGREPVSPSDMRRAVQVNVREELDRVGRASLKAAWRIMVADVEGKIRWLE